MPASSAAACVRAAVKQLRHTQLLSRALYGTGGRGLQDRSPCLRHEQPAPRASSKQLHCLSSVADRLTTQERAGYQFTIVVCGTQNTAIAAYRCIFVLLSMLHTVYKSPQNCDQPLCFSCEHGCVTQVMCWQHVTARRTRLLISHRANTTSIRLTFYHLQRDCNHCVSQSLLLFALVLDLRWSVVCSSLGRSF